MSNNPTPRYQLNIKILDSQLVDFYTNYVSNTNGYTSIGLMTTNTNMLSPYDILQRDYFK